jgi:ubiquinone/menaquinone biosynthesis C-methylase UbiE
MQQSNVPVESGGNELVVEAFTELAPRYVETVDRELRQFWGLGYQDFIRLLLAAVPEGCGHLILDVATGAAQIPLMMASNMAGSDAIVGLDITPAMLLAGQANVNSRGLTSRARLLCASAMQMPFASGTFDLVICGLATHHMHVPQLLSETMRVLKPGGRLVMADVTAPPFWRSSVGNVLLSALSTLYRVTQRSARADAEVAAISNVRTAAEWRVLLTASGFVEVGFVAELRGRRMLYPGALIVQADKRAVSQQSCL